MFGYLKLALAGLTLGAGLVAKTYAGAPSQPTTAPAPEATMCTKCDTVWVKTPTHNDKGRVIGYSWSKKDACPDCMDAITSFVNKGELRHTCKSCGGTMQACNMCETK